MAFENFDRLGKSPDEPYFGKGRKSGMHKENISERLRNGLMFAVMLFVGMFYTPLNFLAHHLNRRRDRKDRKP